MEWKKLTSGQKRAWGVSAGVLGFGAMLKVSFMLGIVETSFS